MKAINHREAFALMWYACECGHRERIWNSRDGVTPFGGIQCTSCGGKGFETRGLTHVDWNLDIRSTDHKLISGQRFFRDGTAADAVRIIERNVAHAAKVGRPIPPKIAAHLRKDAEEQKGQWQQGWPMVDRYAEPQS
ncbi:hypothetical protein JJC00_18945 [Bradyrhizobium diazoefficiens]|uniref:hypothetical protein n=1 Tax=Bradyrhizobium diazoefficiens TaxID=1355477 RepID=UPI00190BA362|nr:hypothetical protein [Bradyrhizobium diazoefficiens]QQO30763.1 hypothetical protein JJC00_18945 [Bradyrhizobium diazoefficiens]